MKGGASSKRVQKRGELASETSSDSGPDVSTHYHLNSSYVFVYIGSEIFRVLCPDLAAQASALMQMQMHFGFNLNWTNNQAVSCTITP